ADGPSDSTHPATGATARLCGAAAKVRLLRIRAARRHHKPALHLAGRPRGGGAGPAAFDPRPSRAQPGPAGPGETRAGRVAVGGGSAAWRTSATIPACALSSSVPRRGAAVSEVAGTSWRP